jgi:hypothetical protein
MLRLCIMRTHSLLSASFCSPSARGSSACNAEQQQQQQQKQHKVVGSACMPYLQQR